MFKFLIASFGVLFSAQLVFAAGKENPNKTAFQVHENEWLAGYYREGRYERTPDQTLGGVGIDGLFLGYHHHDVLYLVEAGRFVVSSGDSILGTLREHTELNFWYFLNPTWQNGIKPYAGVGGGFYQENVQTNFLTQTQIDHGQLLPLVGVAMGVREEFFNCVNVGVEMRLMLAQNWDPQYQGSLLLRLGVAF